MDKLLISSLFALLAGFLTAVLSYVKLLNDKEGRVTDYRQDWTNSARKTLADLTSKIQLLLELICERARRLEKLERLTKLIEQNTFDSGHPKLLALDHHKQLLENVNHEIIATQNGIYSSFALSQLHFKLDDAIYPQIETKFTEVMFHIEAINTYDRDIEKIKITKKRVSDLCNEIIYSSRILLKTEWEIIKKGESTYRLSKKIAVWGGSIFLAVLLVLSTIVLTSYFNTQKINTRENVLGSGIKSEYMEIVAKSRNIETSLAPVDRAITNNCTISFPEYLNRSDTSHSQAHGNLNLNSNAKVKSQQRPTVPINKACE